MGFGGGAMEMFKYWIIMMAVPVWRFTKTHQAHHGDEWIICSINQISIKLFTFFKSPNERAATDPVRAVAGDRPQTLLPLAQGCPLLTLALRKLSSSQDPKYRDKLYVFDISLVLKKIYPRRLKNAKTWGRDSWKAL